MPPLVARICKEIREINECHDREAANETGLVAHEIIRKHMMCVDSDVCPIVNQYKPYTSEDIQAIRDIMVEHIENNPLSREIDSFFDTLADLGDSSLKPFFEKYLEEYLSRALVSSGCLCSLAFALSLLGEDILESGTQGTYEHAQNISQAYNYCKKKKIPLTFFDKKPIW